MAEWHTRVALAVGLWVAGAACHSPPPASEQHVPEVRLYGVKLTSFRGAVKVASGTAVKVAYARGPAEVTAEGADLHVVQTTRDPRTDVSVPTGAFTDLQAPELVGNLLTRTFDGSGGVRMESSSGLKGATERAHFEAGPQRVTGHEPVRVTGPGYALNALGMALDLRSEDYVFDGPLTTRIGGTP